MATLEEMEELAAEYALGSLPRAERDEAEAMIKSDPQFARLVRGWERRCAVWPWTRVRAACLD